MTQTRYLPFPFVDMSGTASRKRGWLVFAATLAGILAVALLAEAVPDVRRWLMPLLGPLVAIQVITTVQGLHDAGLLGYWASLAPLPLPVLGIVAMLVINALPTRPGAFAPPGHIWAQRLGYLGLCALIVLVFLRAFVGVNWVASSSMKPALLVGDYLLEPFVAPDQVRRGDVLAFRHPTNGNDFVKRLIGLPGDLVQMQGVKLVLNGTEVPQVTVGDFIETYGRQGPYGTVPRCQNAVFETGDTCIKAMAHETLPDGPSYSVLDIVGETQADDTGLFIVPAGQLFFMSDNRDNSFVSRFAQGVDSVGFVLMSSVIGRVSRIVFSSAGTSMLDVGAWRSGRYWRAVE
jgi:signal peptidase I